MLESRNAAAKQSLMLTNNSTSEITSMRKQELPILFLSK